MKKYRLLFMAIVISCTSSAQDINIVPRPLVIRSEPGQFIIGSGTVVNTDLSSLPAARYFCLYLDSFYHIKATLITGILPQASPGTIAIVAPDSLKGKEHYSLTVSSSRLEIKGSPAGVFYGVQSLIQLLPATVSNPVQIPAVFIEDGPRFAWRGLSLDVSRHFFSVAEVKKYIDLMAHYKLNVFHWHLTDDEGWRIQIDKYPRLTEIGSRMNVWAKEKKFRPLTNIIDGGSEGFYSKSEIREIVRYAEDRYITILPEIEMPGHCEAAVYAYPELGCADSTGERQKQLPWPRNRMYDPSEKTFSFLEDVLTELMDLFPGKYIHIGGDEAEMKDWLKSPAAIALMKREGLQNEKEIQSYFIKRIERFLLSHGKKLVGWDEILEGGLAPTATVMSWRGEEGGIAAAKMGHPVVMTPLPFVYFDAPQSDDPTEPIGWNYPLSWQHVYGYEPLAASLNAKEAGFILGPQANIWAEKIPGDDHLEYMVYPRALALAEVAWSARERKDILSMTNRLNKQFELFKLWKVEARIPDLEGLQTVSTNKNELTIPLKYPLSDAKIFYTLDGRTPDTSSALGRQTLRINLSGKDSVILQTLVLSSLSKQHRYQKNIIKKIVVAPVLQKALIDGMHYDVFEKELDPDSLINHVPQRAGQMTVIQLPDTSSGLSYHTIHFDGYLRIDHAGDYLFRISSDGETILTLDGQELINNMGYHGTVEKESLLHLIKGNYAFNLHYNNEEESGKLKLYLSEMNGKDNLVPLLFFH